MIRRKASRHAREQSSRQSVVAELRQSVSREIQDPWGRINCRVGIILLILVIADIAQGILVALGVKLHWGVINLVFSVHGIENFWLSITLLVVTVGYWVFCINNFKQLRPHD